MANTPPMPGPKIIPPLKEADNQPITRARFFRVVISAANAVMDGIDKVAAKPPSTRAKFRYQSDCPIPMAKTASEMAKSNRPAAMMGMRANLSDNRPIMGEAINCTAANKAAIIPISIAVRPISVLI